MNSVKRALVELRMDMVRDPGGLEETELTGLLAGVFAESDAALRCAAELCGLDVEALEERAGILQFDAGLSRAAANRTALTYALRDKCPDVTDAVGRWLMRNAEDFLAYRRAYDAEPKPVTVAEVLRAYRKATAPKAAMPKLAAEVRALHAGG